MKRSFEGSIFHSKETKAWIARLRYTDRDGMRREKKRTCKTHAAAKEKIKHLRAEIERDNSDRKTFRELDAFYRKKYLHDAKFIDGRKISGFRQNLWGVYYYLDHALEHFGDRLIDTITYADLQDYKAKIVALPKPTGGQRSYSSINHFLKCLRRVFNVAIEQEWLLVNPFAKGEPLIRVSFEEQRTRILSPVEESRLLAECSGKRRHLRPIVIFAIETACRKNEILTLKWRNVNFEGRFIQIESHNTKTLRGRYVPISGKLAGVLRELWDASPMQLDLPIFLSGDFKKSFVRACEAAELSDLNFHDLRHTAITRMLEKNISPPLVMKISGHTQSKTFLRYVNQSESSIFDIALRLDMAA